MHLHRRRVTSTSIGERRAPGVNVANLTAAEEQQSRTRVAAIGCPWPKILGAQTQGGAWKMFENKFKNFTKQIKTFLNLLIKIISKYLKIN